MIRFNKGHALLIGVRDYRDPKLRLPIPITIADATGIAKVLKDPAVGAYPPRQVNVVSGKKATRAGVISALTKFAARTQIDDTALVFFCGHGVLGEDGLYYFTTQDTSLTPTNLVKKGTGLSKPELIDLLRAIPAQKLLFIINACFSGHVSPTLGPLHRLLGAAPPSSLSVEVLATGEGRAIITASRASQYSYFEHTHVHTHFGQALIDGLSGKGVGNSEGYVGLYELYQSVYAKVKAATNGAQEPVLTILHANRQRIAQF
jgi:uncharacterized caspase-like protein